MVRTLCLPLIACLAALLGGCTSPTSSGTVSTDSAPGWSDEGLAFPGASGLGAKYTTRTINATASPSTWGALNCHDPDLFQDDDGTYYCFSTDASLGGAWDSARGQGGIQVRTSTDLQAWTCLSTPAFTAIPEEVKAWCFTNLDGSASTPSLWAPCVIKKNGVYYLYYGVNADIYADSSRTTWIKAHAYIGVATAATAAGPYTPLGRIVRSTTLRNDPAVLGDETLTCHNTAYGAIDPSIVVDADGQTWMNYGSWRGGIALLKLDNATGLPSKDPDQAYADGDANPYGVRVAGGGGASYEGAQVFYPGSGAWYYVLISSGDLNTDYSVRLGRRAVAEGIAGPYRDADGFDLTKVVYTWDHDDNSHLHGTKILGSFQFGSQLSWRAPGGISVLKNAEGTWLMAHHTRTGFRAGYYFYLQVRQMFFNQDGWPLVNPNEYAGEHLQALSRTQVAGPYDAVRTLRTGTQAPWTDTYWNNLVYPKVNGADAVPTASHPLWLRADGTLGGGTWTGTWTVSGSTVTLSLADAEGGVLGTYSGFAVPSWDASRERLGSGVPRGTLALTALGSDGEVLTANRRNY